MTTPCGDPITQVNLRMKNRSTFSHRFDVKDVTGAAVNLTGYVAIAEFKNSAGILIHTSTVANAELIVDPASKVFIEILGATIAAFSIDNMIYDLFIISATGKPYAIARGSVTIFESVTNPADI